MIGFQGMRLAGLNVAFAVAGGVLGSTWVRAADFPAECKDSRRVVDQVKVQSLWSSQKRACMVSVDPFTSVGLVYRSYLFNEDGLMMVFNSFGEGPDATYTGARDFYFFPRLGVPVYRVSSPDSPVTSLDVRLPSGQVMVFEGKSGSMLSLTGAEVRVDPEVRRENEGGVEIQVRQGLMLDCGFTLGNRPAAQPLRKSVFKDSQGGECVVQNREIFERSASGDFRLRFRKDQDLADFLLWRCPGLEVAALMSAGALRE